MSRSVDLFISSPETLEAVASTIRELSGVAVDSVLDGSFTVREGETSLALSSHGYVDDGDLFLSRYPYVLSGTVPATARPQDTAVAALVRRVGTALQRGTSWPVLLVLDLQFREPLPDGSRAPGPTGNVDGEDAAR